MSFGSFPVELHQQILCFMDPEGIVAMRKAIYQPSLGLGLER